MNEIFFCICAVSDRCSSGEMEDKSGQTLYDLVTKHLSPASITRALIPDDVDKIEVCKMFFYAEKIDCSLFSFTFH